MDQDVDGKGHPSEPVGARIESSASGRFAALTQTKANAHIGLACDIAIGIGLVAFGETRISSGVALPMSAFLAGLLFFTFVEYAFHRWLFHGAIAFFRQGHTQHHLHPKNDDALPFFAPPLAMLGLAALLAHFIRSDLAAFFVGGVAFGYACYGLGHTVIHRRRFALSWPRAWAARHHIHHNHPAKNFGVTTPLWDMLLGTRYARRSPLDAARQVRQKNIS